MVPPLLACAMLAGCTAAPVSDQHQVTGNAVVEWDPQEATRQVTPRIMT